MNMAERVIAFLRKNLGLVICDDCLQAELNTRYSITSILGVLNPRYFHRTEAVCDRCGERKLTIEEFERP